MQRRYQPPMMKGYPDVAILGHSFIRDIQTYFNGKILEDELESVRSGDIPPNVVYADYFSVQQIYATVSLHVAYRARGRLLQKTVKEVGQRFLDICLVQLGSDDLADGRVDPYCYKFHLKGKYCANENWTYRHECPCGRGVHPQHCCTTKRKDDSKQSGKEGQTPKSSNAN